MHIGSPTMIKPKRHHKLFGWALVLSVGIIAFGHFYEASYLQRTPPLTLVYAQSLRAQLADTDSDLPADNARPKVVVAATQPAASSPTPVTYTLTAPVQLPKPVGSAKSSAKAPVTNITHVTVVAPQPSGLTLPSGTQICKPTQDDYSSSNWSGYAATVGGYTSVKGSWQVPQPTGNGATASLDSTWVGIGGLNTKDLIQVGTINLVQSNGSVQASAFYELLPAAAIYIPNFPVKGGDKISASIVQTSVGVWHISITNATTGSDYSTDVTYTSGYATVEWIQEDPSCADNTLMPFDRFGSVNINGGSAAIGSRTLTIAGSQATPITLVDSNRQPLATPSALGADGASFTVTQN